MKSSFGKWIEKKVSEHSENRGGRALPGLPNRRPRALTPSPSLRTLPQKSPFFCKLPYDVRRQILVAAFGDRTLHMDLSFNHPTFPIPEGLEKWYHCHVHGRINGNDRGSRDSILLLDEEQPKSWHWWGSVCHRNPPKSAMENFKSQKDRGSPPAADTCRFGAARCKEWPGDVPYKCRIGIMGWLLTCRIAYQEGIDVLYRTNTIYMASQLLILNISKLLLPQRLSSITSLEIVWRLECLPGKTNRVVREGHLEMLLQSLLSNFPNLRRLHVSIQPPSGAPGSVRWLDYEGILGRLDQFAQELPPMVDLVFGLPVTVFRKILKKEVEKFFWENNYQIWRFIGGQHVAIKDGADLDPNPPYPIPGSDPNQPNSGYWIVAGSNDRSKMPSYVVACFGSSDFDFDE